MIASKSDEGWDQSQSIILAEKKRAMLQARAVSNINRLFLVKFFHIKHHIFA